MGSSLTQGRPRRFEDGEPIRARIPADVEAPDRVMWGLNARQVAILAVAAVAGYLLWRGLAGLVPAEVLIAVLIPPGVVVTVATLSRRDGVSLDAWLLSAARHARAERRLTPAAAGVATPPRWAPPGTSPPRRWGRVGRRATGGVGRPPAALRLPAAAVGDDGVIDLGDRTAMVVAVDTVNIALRTATEQAQLIGGFARWANALTGPAQIVVSTQRVDLPGHARRAAQAADAIRDPVLAASAGDYAAFLDELAQTWEPVCRAVTVTCTSPAAPAGGSARRGAAGDLARRTAAQTAAMLGALGCRTRPLEGPHTAAVLRAAASPGHAAPLTTARGLPQHPITAPTGGDRW